MKRAIALLYGTLCYLFFLAVFFRAIWFVWRMDGLAPRSTLGAAILIDALLLGLFAVQHSGMARQGFKHVWTKLVPQPLERSTYVLFSSAVLLAIVEFWQPIPGVIWQVHAQTAVLLLNGLFWFGWLLLFICTFLIDHYDLFGLRQVWRYFNKESYQQPAFKTPGPYRLVRHPLYLGFLIAFWSAPRMSSGRLFFAVMCTAYILLAIRFEERDLITYHGESYLVYRSGVSMLVPWTKKGRTG
jgi:methanethiol S-methyltransferase